MNPIKPALLIDSHCHLHSIDLTEFGHELDEVVLKAQENGVERLLCVCLEPADVPRLHQFAEKYSNVFLSAGIHPNIVLSDELDSEQIVSLANHPACIAIGETGLDYYRTDVEEARKIQGFRFRQHIQAALASNKSLIIHTRNAAKDTLQYMTEENASEVGGVMHCFTEDWKMARSALDLNFYISFSGIVTFKNATQLQEVAKKVPLDRLLIETDAPYLAPVPFRGRQNHPALVKHVALAISELRQIDYETLAFQTTENFYRCFRIE